MTKKIIFVSVFLMGSFSVWSQSKNKQQFQESAVQMQIVDDGEGSGGTCNADGSLATVSQQITQDRQCGYTKISYSATPNQPGFVVGAFDSYGNLYFSEDILYSNVDLALHTYMPSNSTCRSPIDGTTESIVVNLPPTMYLNVENSELDLCIDLPQIINADITNGNSDPTIEWYKKRVDQGDGYYNKIFGESSSSFELTNISPNAYTFKCVLTIENGGCAGTQISTTINVDVKPNSWSGVEIGSPGDYCPGTLPGLISVSSSANGDYFIPYYFKLFRGTNTNSSNLLQIKGATKDAPLNVVFDRVYDGTYTVLVVHKSGSSECSSFSRTFSFKEIELESASVSVPTNVICSSDEDLVFDVSGPGILMNNFTGTFEMNPSGTSGTITIASQDVKPGPSFTYLMSFDQGCGYTQEFSKTMYRALSTNTTPTILDLTEEELSIKCDDNLTTKEINPTVNKSEDYFITQQRNEQDEPEPVGMTTEFRWTKLDGSGEQFVGDVWVQNLNAGSYSYRIEAYPTACPLMTSPVGTVSFDVEPELTAPDAPVIENNTTCFTGKLDLQTSGFAAYEWYKGSTKLSPTGSNYVSDLSSGLGSYKVKGVYYEDSDENIYCTTAKSDAVSVTAFSIDECEDFLNTVTAKTFGIDSEGNEIEIAASKNYFDLAGEALQSQSTTYNAAGQLQVMATQSLDDTYGRSVLTTLAAPTSSTEFLYKHDFVSTTEDGERVRYESRHFDAAGTKNSPNALDHEVPGTLGYYYGPNNTIEDNVPQTGYPYSRIEYAEDGTGDVKRASGPGEKLRMGANHETYTDRIKVDDPDSELPYYDAIRTKLVGIIQSINKVYKEKLTDPDGKTTYTYHSPEGVVATKITDPEDPTEIHWSYNFYNNAGRLAASMAPLGVEDILTNGVPTSKDNLLFTTFYKYDYLGRLIEMEEPDAGLTKYLYRKDGSIRFSENALQRGSAYSYTRYDPLSRPIESGEYEATDFASLADNFDALEETDSYTAPSVSNDKVETYYDLPYKNGSDELKDELASYMNDWYDDQLGAGHGYNINTLSGYYVQDFLDGAVSYTKNENTTTWYSYDEFGQVTFIVMKYEHMKYNNEEDQSQFFTINYEYDYYGNVIEVAYQKYFAGESFYHHYEYNKNQQLTKVYTSQSGVNDPYKYLHATYHYYLHGPLKRVELAENLQGVDYTYTVQGWLKAINSPASNLDPGEDGENTFSRDAFGMEVDYYDGDHSSNKYTSINAQTDSPELFGGNIRSISWAREGTASDQALALEDENLSASLTEDTQVEAQSRIKLEPGFMSNGYAFKGTINPLMIKDIPMKIESQQYEYTYDFKNQLNEATYTDAVASTSTDNRYAVKGLDYDANGNIKTLQRYDDAGDLTDNFTYTYVDEKNQLDNVSGYASYNYNTIGQMTASLGRGEYGSQYFDYDVTGKVTNIYSDDAKTNVVASYQYDDRGFRIMKETNGQTTWYVRDASGNILAIYENDGSSTKLKELPIYGSGKIGTSFKNDYRHKYNYELTDHLGNVRAVVSKLKFFEVATMETENQVSESSVFENWSNFRQMDMALNTTNISGDEKYSVRLDGSTGIVGPAMSRAVQKGDKIAFSAQAMYVDGFTSTGLADDMFGLVAGAYGVTSSTETQQVFDGLNSAVASAAGFLATPPAGVPKAYIQCLMFDKDFNDITPDGAYAMVSSDAAGNASTAQLISQEIEMPEDGYIYIYVANETEGALVNFDDMTVSIVGFEVTEMTDYYPFGSVAMQYQKESTEDYRFGYQGQFAEEDKETGFNHFEARAYDPIIGRWMMPDPAKQFHSNYLAMGNNPVSLIDPNGEAVPLAVLAWQFVIRPAIQGAALELGTQYLENVVVLTMQSENGLNKDVFVNSLERIDWADVGLEGAYGVVDQFTLKANSIEKFTRVASKFVIIAAKAGFDVNFDEAAFKENPTEYAMDFTAEVIEKGLAKFFKKGGAEKLGEVLSSGLEVEKEIIKTKIIPQDDVKTKN